MTGPNGGGSDGGGTGPGRIAALSDPTGEPVPGPNPFPPPPKRGDTVLFAGRVTVVDDVYFGSTVCTRCLGFHPDYAVRLRRRVDGCLVRPYRSLADEAEEWAQRLVGAR